MAEPIPFRLPAVSVSPRAPTPLRMPIERSDTMRRLGVQLRAETPADIGFTHGLYAETRAAEMLMMRQWDEATKRDFVDKQFSYQYLHHSRHYRDADFAIVEIAGRPIGRFYTHWHGLNRDCSLVEIQLISAMRGRGIGAQLITALQQRAREASYSVSLYVDRMSPARRLYTRLGFQPTGIEADNGSFEMRWRPGTAAAGLRLVG